MLPGSGDTIVEITLDQMNKLTLVMAQLDGLKDENIQQKKIVGTMEVTIMERDSAIATLTEAVDIQTGRLLSATEILKTTEKVLKDYNRKVTWLKIQRGLLGTLAVAEAVVIAMISIK